MTAGRERRPFSVAVRFFSNSEAGAMLLARLSAAMIGQRAVVVEGLSFNVESISDGPLPAVRSAYLVAQEDKHSATPQPGPSARPASTEAVAPDV